MLILVMGRLVSSDEEEAPPPPPPVPTQNVVVTKAPLTAGKDIGAEAITVEARPAPSLPPDAITSLEDLTGKVPAAPIPAGYVLTKTLLTDPPKQVEPTKEPQREDPCELKLQKLKTQQMLAINVSFSSPAPKRCQQIAANVLTPNGTLMLVATEAYVEQPNGNSANVLVKADAVESLLTAYRKAGSLSYVEIPEGAENPYRGRPIPTVEQVLIAFEPPQPPGPESPNPTPKDPKDPRRLRDFCAGFAKKEDTKYCLGKDGRLYEIDAVTGELVWKTFDGILPEDGAMKEEHGGGDPAGLEPLFPLTGLSEG